MEDEGSHSIQDMRLYLQQVGITDYSEGQFAGSINTLLRNRSIIKVDRAIYARNNNRREGTTNMKYCFVVSPIGDEGSETRNNADKLLKHVINPVCRDCGFKVDRVDQMNDSTSIPQTIIEKLQTADLVIADISGHNPNVFYEMGFRKCTGKPIIHLMKKGEKIPFDVNTVRTFDYDLTDLDSVDAIKQRLQQTISAFTYDTEDDAEDSEASPNEKRVPEVLPVLYQIQDSIAGLKEEVSKYNKEVIQTIMETSLNNMPKEESLEAVMMKALLPEFIKNPQSFANMMKLSDMANNAKK